MCVCVSAQTDGWANGGTDRRTTHAHTPHTGAQFQMSASDAGVPPSANRCDFCGRFGHDGENCKTRQQFALLETASMQSRKERRVCACMCVPCMYSMPLHAPVAARCRPMPACSQGVEAEHSSPQKYSRRPAKHSRDSENCHADAVLPRPLLFFLVLSFRRPHDRPPHLPSPSPSLISYSYTQPQLSIVAVLIVLHFFFCRGHQP